MEFGRKTGVSYRIREAVYAVVMDKQTDLVAIMIHNGKGFLPGGGLNPSETHTQCLERECVEETGYTLKIDQYVGNVKQYFQSRQKEAILNDGHFYTGCFGDYVNPPVDEDHELVWMGMDQAFKMLLHRSHGWAVEEAFKLNQSHYAG